MFIRSSSIPRLLPQKHRRSGNPPVLRPPRSNLWSCRLCFARWPGSPGQAPKPYPDRQVCQSPARQRSRRSALSGLPEIGEHPRQRQGIKYRSPQKDKYPDLRRPSSLLTSSRSIPPVINGYTYSVTVLLSIESRSAISDRIIGCEARISLRSWLPLRIGYEISGFYPYNKPLSIPT